MACQSIGLTANTFEGNHLSSDFNWLRPNEVICWCYVTRLMCQFCNSCMLVMCWPAALVERWPPIDFAACGWVVWIWRQVWSSWKGYAEVAFRPLGSTCMCGKKATCIVWSTNEDPRVNHILTLVVKKITFISTQASYLVSPSNMAGCLLASHFYRH